MLSSLQRPRTCAVLPGAALIIAIGQQPGQTWRPPDGSRHRQSGGHPVEGYHHAVTATGAYGSLTDATEADQDGDEQPDFAPLYVERMQLKNFRGLENCAIEFEEDLTLLVGRNNSGKSRLLRALAVGLGTRAAEKDDLTVGGTSNATIDIVLAPSRAGTSTSEQMFDDRVGSRLGSMVQNLSEEPAQERFAWRTTIRPSQEGLGVQTESAIMIYNLIEQRWRPQGNPTLLSTRQRSIVAADLVQTRRDLAEELTRRGSPIRRILDDLEVEQKTRDMLESRLKDLGDEIVSSSKSLDALDKSLKLLTHSIDEIGLPRFEPLPVRLEELARSVSINLDTGGGDLPMRFHGSGARSLASLQVQSVLYDRRLGRDGPALLPHPVSLIEEPESHLHPQAQFELEGLLQSMRGQVVVTTHSTHLVSVVEPRSLRLLKRRADGAGVVDLKPAASNQSTPHRALKPTLHLEEMEKIRRLVERPFGELLFSSAIIIGDGATERALLPPLLRHALKGRAHGVCVVDPGSMAGAHVGAIVKFAKLMEIPWFLFSDSDDEGRAAAKRVTDTHAGGDKNRVIWVPEEAPKNTKGGATEKMLSEFDSALCERACEPLGYQPGDDVMAFMIKHKGAIGRLVAAELIRLGKWPEDEESRKKHWPAALYELVTRLDCALPRLKANL